MDELRSWPEVSERPMFGFQSFYRGSTIFAALPKTRSLSRNGMMFKLPVITPELRAAVAADPKVNVNSGHRWVNFELSTEEDIHGALHWLAIAYDCALKRSAKTKKKTGR